MKAPVHEIAAEMMEESPTEPTKSVNQSFHPGHRPIEQSRGSTSTQALFSSQKVVKNGTVALSFLFDKHCPIIE